MSRMKFKFKSTKLHNTYKQAFGKIFTHSPTFHAFTDQDGNQDYDYGSMLYFLYHGYLERLPFDGVTLTNKYKLRKV